MRIIQIAALPNGAHNNQNISMSFTKVPTGWAVIPDDMITPPTFPFVDIEVKDGVVVGMTPGVVPEPVPKEPGEPTQLDIIEAQITYTALMTDTLLTQEVETDER